MRSFFKISLLVMLAVSLSACGFHLRGQLPIAEAANVIFLDGKASNFKTDLAKRLIQNGASIVDGSSAAKVTLIVSEPELERSVATVDERGRENSFRLVYRVDYALTNKQGEVIKSQPLSETRTYAFDSSRLLDQQREEVDLIEDMNDELVLKLVRQLTRI